MSFTDVVSTATSALGFQSSGFAQRLLQVQINLAQGAGALQPTSFPPSLTSVGGNSVTIGGTVATQLRMRCRIQNSGAFLDNMAQLDIWGLDFPTMQQLSTLGMLLDAIPRNTITIKAGDQSSGLSQVYSGDIINAYADSNAAPDVPMHFECQFGAAQAALVANPTSYPDSVSVAAAAQDYAKKLGLTFENNGVTIQLPGSYLDGSVITQAKKLATDSNTDMVVCDGGKTLVICPKNLPRKTTSIITIAPPPIGRMIGYPSYTQQGIKVDTLFDPNIRFRGQVQVISSVLKTSTWVVLQMDLALDSFLPHGEWRSTCYCYSPNRPIPIIPSR